MDTWMALFVGFQMCDRIDSALALANLQFCISACYSFVKFLQLLLITHRVELFSIVSELNMRFT